MRTISSAPAAAQAIAGQFAIGRLLGASKRRVIAHMTRRIEQAAIVSLNAMSDRELKHIGLTRSEIGRAVEGEATHEAAFARYR